MIVLKQNKPLTKSEIDYLFRQPGSWTRFENKDGSIVGRRFKFIKHPNQNRSKRREQQRIEAKKRRQNAIYKNPEKNISLEYNVVGRVWYLRILDWLRKIFK